MLLDLDEAFVTEVRSPREFGDKLLRSCFEEVKAGFVGSKVNRAEISHRVAFGAQRRSSGVRSIFQIGQFSAGDVRLDQVRGHALEATVLKPVTEMEISLEICGMCP